MCAHHYQSTSFQAQISELDKMPLKRPINDHTARHFIYVSTVTLLEETPTVFPAQLPQQLYHLVSVVKGYGRPPNQNNNSVF